MLKFIKKKTKPITLKQHYHRRNKVLVKRRLGGTGDILMQRMMFENFSTQFPHMEFSWCVPYEFIGFAYNHPYVNTVEPNDLEHDDYGIIYDITTACRVYEHKHAPPTKNRSDIWSEHCGVTNTTHNMHLTADPIAIENMQKIMQEINPENKPTVLIAAHSTEDEFGVCKTMMDQQITDVVQGLKGLDFVVYSLHSVTLPVYDRLGVNQLTNLSSKDWIAAVSLVDYVISIDTSTFHMAAGLRKPLVGVFSFTDGKVYGKYYDFELVQKHRDNGNWDCGPCFIYHFCPKSNTSPKPCMSELTHLDILRAFAKVVLKSPSSKNGPKNLEIYSLL